MNRDLEKVRSIAIYEEHIAGMDLRLEQTLAIKAGRVACFQVGRLTKASVVCVFFFEGGPLTVRYDGDEEFAKDTYNVVMSARLFSINPSEPHK